MTATARMVRLLVVALVAAALATSACGRKGPPVAPSEADEESR